MQYLFRVIPKFLRDRTGPVANFPDERAGRARKRHGSTFGYGVWFQTSLFLPLIASRQVRQSATPLQIVRGKILRQARVGRRLRPTRCACRD